MRKRKLYLSELLNRNVLKDEIAVHIGKPYEVYYDTIGQAITDLKESKLWDLEVNEYLVDEWINWKGEPIPTIYIKCK